MRQQHLSDEAIAAFADDVLRGHARERAMRHTATCTECKHAVAGQREAVWALRAAPAPALPSGLLDRLREVPATTPINTVRTTIGPDGSTMFAAFGSFGAAALVRDGNDDEGAGRARGMRPFVMTAAALAMVSALGAVGANHGTSGRIPAAPAPTHSRHLPADVPVRLAFITAPTRTR